MTLGRYASASRQLSVLIIAALLTFSLQLSNITSSFAEGITFTVTNTNASGAGSFRQALLDANAEPGHDTIAFNLSGQGPFDIPFDPSTLYVTTPVTIDGLTQSGSACGETLQIGITFETAATTPLRFYGGTDGSLIQGIAFSSQGSNGIELYDSGHSVRCNYFNMNHDGTAAVSNQTFLTVNSSQTTIGGDGNDDANYFASDLSLYGINAELLETAVVGNVFGFATDRTTFLGTLAGIDAISYGNGTDLNMEVRNNLIQTMNFNGIESAYFEGVTITGNKICVNDAVTESVCASSDYTDVAIGVNSGKDFVIGGPLSSERNYIANTGGGSYDGIHFANSAGLRRIENNYFNLSADGTSIIANHLGGNSYFDYGQEGTIEVLNNRFVGNYAVNGHHNSISIGMINEISREATVTIDGNYFGYGASRQTLGVSHTNSIVSIKAANASVTNNSFYDNRDTYNENYSYISFDATSSEGGANNNGSLIFDSNDISGPGGSAVVIGELTSATITNNDIDVSQGNSSATAIVSGADVADVSGNTLNTHHGAGVMMKNGEIYDNILEGATEGLMSAVGGISYYWGVGDDSLNIHDNVITGYYVGIYAPSGGLISAYNNSISRSAREAISYSTEANLPNDEGDVDSILNYPVVQSIEDGSSTTTVTYEVDWQPGDYRVELCYSPEVQTFQGSFVEQCNEVIATDEVTISTPGTQELSIVVDGTGFKDYELSMIATEKTGPGEFDLGRTSMVSRPLDASDMAFQSRLLTSGQITSGETVSYELDLGNIGEGSFLGGQLGLFFLLPEGATFTDLVDINPNDGIDVDACFSMGDISQFGPPLDVYSGEFISCQFSSNLGVVPANSHFPMQLNMTASSSFASGETQVIGVLIADGEPDTEVFETAMGNGQDPFLLDINNVFNLVYDSNALTVSVNRCVGQADPTFVDSACFTVEFSKPIWAPSFTSDDLVISGGGTVDSFTQVSDTVWEIEITGMTPGGTVTVSLAPDSVTDYSAVSNDVQVLGDNTIRYGINDPDSGGGTDSGSGGGSSGSDGGSSSDNPSAADPTTNSNSDSSSSSTITDDSASAESDDVPSESDVLDENDKDSNSDKEESAVSQPGDDDPYLILGDLSLTGSNVLDMLIIAMSLILIGLLIHYVRKFLKGEPQPA
jgi:hypothetical protein